MRVQARALIGPITDPAIQALIDEKRHTWLSEWNEDDLMSAMVGSLATLAIQGYVGKGNTELIPARDSNRVWYAYTQAKGRPKEVRKCVSQANSDKCLHVNTTSSLDTISTLHVLHISGNTPTPVP